MAGGTMHARFRLSGGAVMSACLALASVTVAWPSLAKKPKQEASIPPLPLSIAVVEEDGQPVRDDAWIDAQVAEAERLFSQAGVHLRKAASKKLGARFARLETRSDRDALAAELEKGKINVMVVASLRDVDDPSLLRMGVHWRPKSNLKKHYVIMAASALPSTLAHELGHFFGNGHSKVVNNVMSYDRTAGVPPFFDAQQYMKIKAFARIYVGSRELLP
jgi:hypothetical protein